MRSRKEIKKLREHKIPALTFDLVKVDSTAIYGWDLFLEYGEVSLAEAINKAFDRGVGSVLLIGSVYDGL